VSRVGIDDDLRVTVDQVDTAARVHDRGDDLAVNHAEQAGRRLTAGWHSSPQLPVHHGGHRRFDGERVLGVELELEPKGLHGELEERPADQDRRASLNASASVGESSSDTSNDFALSGLRRCN